MKMEHDTIDTLTPIQLSPIEGEGFPAPPLDGEDIGEVKSVSPFSNITKNMKLRNTKLLL